MNDTTILRWVVAAVLVMVVVIVVCLAILRLELAGPQPAHVVVVTPGTYNPPPA